MKIDIKLLKELERSINTSDPKERKIHINILGYGEISLVFEIIGDPENLAYKRLPIFNNEIQVKRHIWAYNSYNRILKDIIGIKVPDFDTAWFKDDDGNIQFYCVQEKLNSDTVGDKAIRHLSDSQILKFIEIMMISLKKVWTFNQKNPRLQVGFDSQISNFSISPFDSNKPSITNNTELIFIDTSTPMLRINGKEAMEPELFTKSAPSFIRPIIKLLFIEEIVSRYYNWRIVAIDLMAQLYKENRADLIPKITRVINLFFKEQASEFNIRPILLSEIYKYYKNDARIWEFFQNLRKFDRFVKTRLFHKKYNFYLPPKIIRY